MKCFDKLPSHLRVWINYLPFNLHDDHILRGAKEIERIKARYESDGGRWYEKKGDNQN